MEAYKRILLATDFSEAARHAAGYAAQLAHLCGAEMHVAHILELNGDDPVSAEKKLSDAVPEECADVVTNRKLTRSLRAELGIIHAARKEGIDLIVMGTRGRTGLKHALLGSVAERVVQLAPCPVLTVRQPADVLKPISASTPTPNIRRVLCPIDFSEHGQEAIAHAEELGRRLGAELVLAHVVPPIHFPAAYTAFPVTPTSIEADIERLSEERLETLAEGVRDRGVRCRIAVGSGTPSVRIVEMVGEEGIDLIVLSTQGRTGLPHVLLGSTAERVVRTSPCPVLTVKATALHQEHEATEGSIGRHASQGAQT